MYGGGERKVRRRWFGIVDLCQMGFGQKQWIMHLVLTHRVVDSLVYTYTHTYIHMTVDPAHFNHIITKRADHKGYCRMLPSGIIFVKKSFNI